MYQGLQDRLLVADSVRRVRRAIRWTRCLPEDPATLIVAVTALQMAAWTLAPALTNSAPPIDVVESTMWGREWVLATGKHPALPSWALEVGRLLTGGAVGWPAYLTSQLFVAATFACVFLLGRDLMGAPRAAAGTLLLTGVSTYAWLTPEFNHNIAQLPFWAGIALALWRAVERQSLAWWCLVGVFAAGGVYAKFSTGLLQVTAAAWILYDDKARRSLATPGPWIGLGVFLVLVTPLMAWLVHHDLQPLQYAAERSHQERPGGVPMFVLSTLGNIAGLLIMLPLIGLVGRGRNDIPSPASLTPSVDPRALHYLIFLAAGPLLLAIASALASGSSLHPGWPSPMFNFLGLLMVGLASPRFQMQTLRRIAALAVGLLVLIPVGYALAVKLDARRLGKPMRVNWPQAEIAQRFSTIWEHEIGRPMRIVSGDSWIAGLVGSTAKDNPSILDNGDLTLSPWITRDRISKEGMLVVWANSEKPMPRQLAEFVAGLAVGEERFKYASSGQEFAIQYVVVPPKRAVD